MIRSVIGLIGLIGLVLAGCQTTAQNPSAPAPATAAGQSASSYPSKSASASATTPAAASTPTDRPLAFIAGKPVTWTDLQVPLTEASGGQVLAETVLDQAVASALAKRSLKVSAELVERERQWLLESLSPDPDQAQRLFSDLCRNRGLGPHRLHQWLTGRAGLRLLVKEDVQVTDAALRQAFELRHGPRYRVRLVVSPTLRQASQVVELAQLGEAFADLALKFSTDPSRAQGGLLDPLSPADPSYPQALRDVVRKLQVGQVSDPVMLDQSFAVVKLEEKIDGQPVQFDDVKAVLTEDVRRDIEQVLMQQLARRLLRETQVTVLDPTLGKSWDAQRQPPND